MCFDKRIQRQIRSGFLLPVKAFLSVRSSTSLRARHKIIFKRFQQLRHYAVHHIAKHYACASPVSEIRKAINITFFVYNG